MQNILKFLWPTQQIKVLVSKSNLNLAPSTHVEEENWLLNVFLWPPHCYKDALSLMVNIKKIKKFFSYV